MHIFISALLSAVVLLELALPTYWQDWQKGADAYDSGHGVARDYAEAVSWFWLAAE
jgi:hypothetical protein